MTIKTLKNFSLAIATMMSLQGLAQDPATADPAPSNNEAASVSFDKPVWTIGLSGVVVDDDGEPFANLFNVGKSWNFLPFPTRVHVDMAINPSWSFEGAATYSQLGSGKVFNNVELNEDHMFFAFDVNAKYHILKNAKIFDPYPVAGLGFTFRSNLQNQTPTLNAGIGTNIWFIPSFGLNLQTQAKVKMIGTSSSYMLHSVGVVYRFIK